jgi:regulator of cell morphogenesis and NO signaling
MTAPTLHTTVGELVRQRPARSRIFEQLKIDYCCGGKIPLAEACSNKSVDAQQVLQRIITDDAVDNRLIDADAMGLADLADHIEHTHHAYLREELPRLEYMTRKVAAVHGEHDPRLHQVRDTFLAFQEEMFSHMAKEEQMLFPMIRQIEKAKSPLAFHCGSLANPIRMMEHEHDNAGDALERFRALTDDFTPPEWACNTFRAMFDAFAALEPNMHQHVHKENNVLFPKALARESELSAKAGQ